MGDPRVFGEPVLDLGETHGQEMTPVEGVEPLADPVRRHMWRGEDVDGADLELW